jgi:hypothetical protein
MSTQWKAAQMTSAQASAAVCELLWIIHRKLKDETAQEFELAEGNLPVPFPDIRSGP